MSMNRDYEEILLQIKAEVDEIPVADNRLLLFHGSKSGLVGDIAPISRDMCDFGKGFYMGTEVEQPLTLICDFDESKFYVMSIDVGNLNTVEVKPDLDWAMLVAYHRGRMENVKGSALYDKYADMTKGADLVVGCIANDRMFYVIDNFFMGNITDQALINSLSALKLGRQYVAKTERACAAIRVEKEIVLSADERVVLRRVAAANRQKGVSLAKEVCRDFRREGKFFDELLKEAK